MFGIRLHLQLAAALAEIEYEMLQRFLVYGNQPLFVAFTRYLDVSLVGMKVIHLQMGQFAHPQSASIEGLNDGPVPMT